MIARFRELAASAGGVCAALAFVLLLGACGASSAQTDALTIGPDAPVTPARRAEAPLLGVNMRHHADARRLPLAQAAGIDFVRTDIAWGVVEEERDEFDFSDWDDLLADIQAAGLDALFILDYANEEYSDDGDINTPEEIAGFSRFATMTAQRYRGRGVVYEIWNEPDVDESRYYHEPADFAALVSSATAAVHAGDADARVVSGGLSWMDFDNYFEPMLAYWREHGTPALTAVGMHPYGTNKPEELIADFQIQDDLQRRFGIDLPIWNTEYGFSSGEAPGARDEDGYGPEGRRRQAVLLARHMLSLWVAGLQRSVWYEFVDDGADGDEPFRNFGMLDDSGAPKPAYTALMTFHQNTDGARLVGAISGLPDGVWGARFEAENRIVAALWVNDPALQVAIAPEQRDLVSVTGLLGGAVARDHFVLRETDGPVYVTWRR